MARSGLVVGLDQNDLSSKYRKIHRIRKEGTSILPEMDEATLLPDCRPIATARPTETTAAGADGVRGRCSPPHPGRPQEVEGLLVRNR